MINKVNKPITYFLISFLIIFILSFSVIFIMEKEISKSKSEDIMASETRIVTTKTQILEDALYRIIGDLGYLNHVYSLRLSENVDSDEIATEWTELAKHKKIYDQIRYIDKNGNEIIKIKYDGVNAYRVDDDTLENKKDRYYFIKTENIKYDQIYISPMDLNMKNNSIEKPFKPVIRFSTPVYSKNGDFDGIIILNYLAKPMIERFNTIACSENADIYLINKDGYFLSSKNPEDEWGFMFEDKHDITYSILYPKEWEQIKLGEGQIVTNNGVFTFKPIYIDKNSIDNLNIMEEGNVISEDVKWFVVSHINQNAPAYKFFATSPISLGVIILKDNLPKILLISLVAFLLAYLIYVNRRTYFKVKYYSEFDSLTQLYNRRYGYNKIKALIDRDERRSNIFSICFIDINGLKQINDYLGHSYGDELIITVAEVMKKQIRDEDLAVRLGGDEFLILFKDVDADESEKIWSRIVANFNEINEKEKRPYIISASHGIIEYDNNQKRGIDDLITKADEKMYLEKEEIKRDLNVIRPKVWLYCEKIDLIYKTAF